MFVMVSVTVVMRVGDNNQEDGRTTLECEQTQSKLQETEGINGLKIKKEIKERKIQKKKKKNIREEIDDEPTSITYLSTSHSRPHRFLTGECSAVPSLQYLCTL